MKLGPFISGVCGTLGFALSILAGVSADNTVDAILTRALLSAGVCYLVGYVVGMIAEQVAAEHARTISNVVATQDAAEAEKQRQDELDEAEGSAPIIAPTASAGSAK